jgi:hypothetical protein
MSNVHPELRESLLLNSNDGGTRSVGEPADGSLTQLKIPTLKTFLIAAAAGKKQTE